VGRQEDDSPAFIESRLEVFFSMNFNVIFDVTSQKRKAEKFGKASAQIHIGTLHDTPGRGDPDSKDADTTSFGLVDTLFAQDPDDPADPSSSGHGQPLGKVPQNPPEQEDRSPDEFAGFVVSFASFHDCTFPD
jgi:hypothetical protein